MMAQQAQRDCISTTELGGARRSKLLLGAPRQPPFTTPSARILRQAEDAYERRRVVKIHTHRVALRIQAFDPAEFKDVLHGDRRCLLVSGIKIEYDLRIVGRADAQPIVPRTAKHIGRLRKWASSHDEQRGERQQQQAYERTESPQSIPRSRENPKSRIG